MLILTIKPGGGDVVITMPDGTTGRVIPLGVMGNQIRLGFAFPRAVTIDREAIHERKRYQNGIATGEISGNSEEPEVVVPVEVNGNVDHGHTLSLSRR